MENKKPSFKKMLKEPALEPHIKTIKTYSLIAIVGLLLAITLVGSLYFLWEIKTSSNKNMRYSKEELTTIINSAFYPENAVVTGSLLGNDIVNLRQKNDSQKGVEKGTFSQFENTIAKSYYSSSDSKYHLDITQGETVIVSTKFDYPINNIHLYKNMVLFSESNPIASSIYTMDFSGSLYNLTFRTQLEDIVNTMLSDGKSIYYTVNDKIYKTDFSGQEHNQIGNTAIGDIVELIGLTNNELYVAINQDVSVINTQNLSQNVKWINTGSVTFNPFVDENGVFYNIVDGISTNSYSLMVNTPENTTMKYDWKYNTHKHSKIGSNWLVFDYSDNLISDDLNGLNRLYSNYKSILSVYVTENKVYLKDVFGKYIEVSL